MDQRDLWSDTLVCSRSPALYHLLCLGHLSLRFKGKQLKRREETTGCLGKHLSYLFQTTNTVGGSKVWEDADEKALWESIEFPAARTIKNNK